jgi:acetolactate decarboxylase
MNRNLFAPFIGLGLLALFSCAPDRPTVAADLHQITQVSVINALMVGRYDGVMPIPEMLRRGDFGVGTLGHLDGELIVLDGTAYQVRGDGAVVEVASDRSTPIAVVTRFHQDGELPLPQVASLTDLDARLDDALPQRNNLVLLPVIRDRNSRRRLLR